MASLVIEEDGKQTVFQIASGANPIGRLPENAIQVLGGTVSGRHAQIVSEAGQCFLEDLGSRNGTFLNQQPVKSRVKLNHNDAIHFGQTPARFEDTVNAPPAPATSGPSSLAGETRNGNIIADGTATVPNITGTVSGRFGLLDANPEAKLKAVLEISSSLAGTVDLTKMVPKILDTLFTIFKFADRGCILLKDDVTGKLVPRAFKHRREGTDSSVRLSRTILSKVLTEKTAILSADAANDAMFDASESISELKIHSMMCAPMLGLNGEPTGVISIDSQSSLGQFTNDDLDILMTVAGQAALSYENARLLQTFLDKQKQDNEMQIAQDVQHALLPEDFPKAEGYDFFASYDSAQAVGGDYYDCFVLPDGRIVLSFGDVAGKGVPGALIMSRMHSCVQSTMQHVHEIEPAMSAINDHMCDSAVEGRFVTYVLCMVNPANHQLVLSNAGHMSPIIRKADGTVESFDDELVGPPIGVVDDYPYDSESRTLEPGDVVVIVTDGVDEAMNPAGELYGTERVIEFVRNGPAKAEELGKAMLADVRRHANGRPQNDDITIMTFGRNPH